MSGRIDAGHVQVGESVVILPVGETATVKSECEGIHLKLSLIHAFPHYILECIIHNMLKVSILLYVLIIF